MNKINSKTFRKIDLINFFTTNKALIILVVLWLVLSLLTGNFFKSTNLINLIKQVCVATVISLGMTMVIASGQMDLSIGTLLGLSGIIMALLSRDLGWKTIPVIIAGLIVGAVGGLINGLLISRFKLNFFIVTMATQYVWAGVGYMLCGNKAVSGLPQAFIYLGQGLIFGKIPMLIVIMLICLIITIVIMNKTRMGREIIAVGGNSQAARVSGINCNRVSMDVFIFSGIAAGIAAVMLTARTAAASTTGGAGMEMDAICAVVLGGTALSGGKANVFGTLLGCLIVGTITNGLTLLRIDTNWQVVAKGLIILFAIMIDAQTEKISKMRMLAVKDKSYVDGMRS